MNERVIHLHVRAPAKPAVGEPCNGCGLCCAAEPCPLGMVIGRRRQGACPALRWDPAGSRYRCGLLADATRAGPLRARIVSRWIAAGKGCDSLLEPACGTG
jgi:hypothetical protein